MSHPRHPHPRVPSRRRLLQAGAGGLVLPGVGLLRPRSVRAAPAADRKFLFIFCRGGWDTSLVFTDQSGTGADVEAEAVATEVGDLTFLDHPERPSVAEFFHSWGDQAAILNGLEVQSVTHQRCTQLMLTGGSDLSADDWPALLAAAATAPLALPHLVLSGPAFAGAHGDRVVRLGDTGQLPALLSGEALADSDHPVAALSSSAEAAVDAFVRDRAAAASARAQAAGLDARAALTDSLETVLGDLATLQALDELDLGVVQEDCARDLEADFQTAAECFSRGLSRCAMVRHNGWCDQGWDTHQNLSLQSVNQEELFGHLLSLAEILRSWPGEQAATLADEVTVVVWSEMGRHPRYNTWGGKDHWTYTSALLFGSGVAGGQVVGGLDDEARGRPVDLVSGEVSDSGTAILPEHLGATLLALAGEDPGDHLGRDVPPIEALIA